MAYMVAKVPDVKDLCNVVVHYMVLPMVDLMDAASNYVVYSIFLHKLYYSHCFFHSFCNIQTNLLLDAH